VSLQIPKNNIGIGKAEKQKAKGLVIQKKGGTRNKSQLATVEFDLATLATP